MSSSSSSATWDVPSTSRGFISTTSRRSDTVKPLEQKTKPPAQQSGEGGVLGGSSAYMTSQSHNSTTVLPPCGGTSLPSGGILSTTTAGPPFGDFNGNHRFAKYMSETNTCVSNPEGSTQPSTSRLESMLERITSLDTNNTGTFGTFVHPSSVRPAGIGSTSAVGGNNFASHVNTFPGTSNAPSFAVPNITAHTTVTRQPGQVSRGMMGTGSTGITPGTSTSFRSQNYLSQ